MAEVTAVDAERRVVHLADGQLAYDILVLAAGAETSWFGNDEWACLAPGLKTIEDALEIRERLMESFERAERSLDPESRISNLTFVIVGGGPTGVEIAGAIREIALHQVPRDYRNVDTTSARIILVEAQDRLLPAGFDETLCVRAARDLRRPVSTRRSASARHATCGKPVWRSASKPASSPSTLRASSYRDMPEPNASPPET
jgi:NADH dehydrogenase